MGLLATRYLVGNKLFFGPFNFFLIIGIVFRASILCFANPRVHHHLELRYSAGDAYLSRHIQSDHRFDSH